MFKMNVMTKDKKVCITSSLFLAIARPKVRNTIVDLLNGSLEAPQALLIGVVV